MADNSRSAFLVFNTRTQKANNSFKPFLDVKGIQEDNINLNQYGK